MDDDNADWLSAADEPEPAPAPKTGTKAKESAPEASNEAPPDDEAPKQPQEAEPEAEYLDPDKLLLFKHWIRPKFLPYKYLYDYRYNYYDDVIDFLNKRSHGIFRDIPVAQTWAERALRTYTNKSNKLRILRQELEDKKLVEETKFSGKFHLHHSKSYINKRYSNILF